MIITERLQRAWLMACAIVLAAAASLAAWSPRAAAGVLAGGGWNLASLWCLAQLLKAWIGPTPSKKRAALWAAVKFPLLYVGAYVLLSQPSVSLAGFGIGFSLVLIWMVAALALSARHLVPAPARRHGR